MKSRKAVKRRLRTSTSQKLRLALGAWAPMAIAALGAVSVGLGNFESVATLGEPAALLAIGVLGVGMGVAGRLKKGGIPASWLREAAGPLLWTVAVWISFRLLASDVPQIVVLPAGYLAWLVISYRPAVLWLPLAAALGMEIALFLTAEQTAGQFAANLAAFGVGIGGLLLFARSRVYRHRLRRAFSRAKDEAETSEYVRDLDFFGGHAGEGFKAPEVSRRSTVESISSSFTMQLELLRQTLALTTVALLLPDAEGEGWRLRSHASARNDLQPGPYPRGQGITGALFRAGNEVAMAPVSADYRGLPYYRDTEGVGGIYAIRIPGEIPVKGESENFGILCVDRVERSPWEEGTCRILQLAARKIALEVSMSCWLKEMDQDRQAFQQVYFGLRELNGALGLESAFLASLKAIKAMVQADFVAISLVEGDQHRVVHAEGRGAEKLIDLEFPRSEGLVGQVLKLNHALPPGGEYRGPAPVFSRDQRLAEFGSLLILPLSKEKGKTIGALVVAAAERGIFTETGRQILELIATQVAIKIDLARAHERINNMAATDGLTGLANHRTFQHGFDRMLYRAKRRQLPMCILLCDLDYFKKINDDYGHPFGDKVLKAVAGILGSTVRKVDLPARYGGEEFAVLLEETDRHTGLQVAERIRQQVQSLTFRHENQLVSPTISVGLAVCPEDGEEKAVLISRADQALYHAKETGRNRISLWAELPAEARKQIASA
jgi:two-component system, cell cycle response regulator